MKFIDNLKENQIALISYVVILSLFSIYFLSSKDISQLGFEVAIFALLLVIGVFSILYYGRNKKNLYKVAFIVILLFGLVSVFLSPICDISDEAEHFTRVEIISEGQIIPDFTLIPGTSDYSYKTIQSVSDLILNSNVNIFNTEVDDGKINGNVSYFGSAFAQNPFYAYLIPAVGMLLVKILDLNAIWLLWIPRIANLLVYAAIISFAVKKSPVFKFPLLVVSIVPLAIYQAASVSADCIFNAFAILAVAYFFVLYKADRIRWREIGIFYLSIVLCGLLKAPYLALSLLIFAVPSENFRDTTQNIISKLGILAVLAIGVLWNGYSAPQILKSWRLEDFANRHVNATEQADFLMANPLVGISNFFKNIYDMPVIVDRLFYFSNSKGQYNSTLLAALYSVFMILFSLFYPLKEKLSKLNRLKVAITGLIIYTGIFFVQYLTWVPVGSTNVTEGVFGRYFIPLILFLPLIFNLDMKNKMDRKVLSSIVMAIAIGFVAGAFMLTVGVKY